MQGPMSHDEPGARRRVTRHGDEDEGSMCAPCSPLRITPAAHCTAAGILASAAGGDSPGLFLTPLGSKDLLHSLGGGGGGRVWWPSDGGARAPTPHTSSPTTPCWLVSEEHTEDGSSRATLQSSATAGGRRDASPPSVTHARRPSPAAPSFEAEACSGGAPLQAAASSSGSHSQHFHSAAASPPVPVPTGLWGTPLEDTVAPFARTGSAVQTPSPTGGVHAAPPAASCSSACSDSDSGSDASDYRRVFSPRRPAGFDAPRACQQPRGGAASGGAPGRAPGSLHRATASVATCAAPRSASPASAAAGAGCIAAGAGRDPATPRQHMFPCGLATLSPHADDVVLACPDRFVSRMPEWRSLYSAHVHAGANKVPDPTRHLTTSRAGHGFAVCGSQGAQVLRPGRTRRSLLSALMQLADRPPSECNTLAPAPRSQWHQGGSAGRHHTRALPSALPPASMLMSAGVAAASAAASAVWGMGAAWSATLGMGASSSGSSRGSSSGGSSSGGFVGGFGDGGGPIGGGWEHLGRLPHASASGGGRHDTLLTDQGRVGPGARVREAMAAAAARRDKAHSSELWARVTGER